MLASLTERGHQEQRGYSTEPGDVVGGQCFFCDTTGARRVASVSALGKFCCESCKDQYTDRIRPFALWCEAAAQTTYGDLLPSGLRILSYLWESSRKQETLRSRGDRAMGDYLPAGCLFCGDKPASIVRFHLRPGIHMLDARVCPECRPLIDRPGFGAPFDVDRMAMYAQQIEGKRVSSVTTTTNSYDLRNATSLKDVKVIDPEHISDDLLNDPIANLNIVYDGTDHLVAKRPGMTLLSLVMERYIAPSSPAEVIRYWLEANTRYLGRNLS